MKQPLLVSFAAVTLAAAGWSATASACEHEKGASAVVASNSKTCTPAEMAACKNKTKTTAVTASTASKTTTTAMAAGSSCCQAKGAKTSAAATKSGGASHCSGKTNGAVTAGEAGDAWDAVAAGGSHCSGNGMVKSADKMTHAGCDACADMAMCQEELSTVGAQTQVVPLKNGIMIVYTADAPKNIRAVQTAMARRNDRLSIIAASGEKSTLCPECKYMRGAIASGKLNREIVNIEGGCLTLMTSNDKAVVSRLHAMSGVQTAARVKS